MPVLQVRVRAGFEKQFDNLGRRFALSFPAEGPHQRGAAVDVARVGVRAVVQEGFYGAEFLDTLIVSSEVEWSVPVFGFPRYRVGPAMISSSITPMSAAYFAALKIGGGPLVRFGGLIGIGSLTEALGGHFGPVLEEFG